MKLFEVSYQDDCEFEIIFMVGESAKSVYEKFGETAEERLSCYMGHSVREIVNIDGYNIKLEKSDNVNSNSYGEIYPTKEMREQAEKEWKKCHDEFISKINNLK